VFQQRVGDLLAFKTLTAGENVGIINEKDTIVLSAAGTTAANVGAGEGEVFRDKSGDQLNLRTLSAGTNVSIATNSDTVTINATASGDVVGPASSTNNAIALFDGTTGKLLKQSSAPAVIDASNNMSGVNDLTLTGNLNIPVSDSGATQGVINVTGVGPSFYVPNASTVVAGPNAGSSVVLSGAITNTVLVGANAGASLDLTGNSNTLIGASAGDALTTGTSNVAIGQNALGSVTDTAQNVAVGAQALAALFGLPGLTNHNVAIGYNTMPAAFATIPGGETISENVVIGARALEIEGTIGAKNCFRNVIIGESSGRNINDACGQNVFVGASAVLQAREISDSIAIGHQAGINWNTAIHYADNIAIGAFGQTNELKTIRIGELATQNRNFQAGIYGATPSIADPFVTLIDSAGQLGTAATTAFINGVRGVGVAGGNPVVIDAAGKLGDGTVSSQRYKDLIETLSLNASSILSKLRPVSFFYKEQKLEERKNKNIGLIAEEVHEIYPPLVILHKDTHEPDGVKYQDLPVLLLKAFQEQQVIINAQQNLLQQLQQALQQQEQILQELLSTLKKS
jgi:hypothetical protein